MALKKNLNAEAAQKPAFEAEDGDTATVVETAATAVVGNVDLSEVGDDEGTGVTSDLSPASADDAAAATSAAAKQEKSASAPSAEEVVKATTTAIALAKQNAVATATKKFSGALQHLENVFDPAGMDFNTFPRIVVGLGGFSDDSDNELGSEIGLELMSYNTRYTLSPGVDDDDAKQHVRFSLDGVTLDCPSNPDQHGMPCAAYLKILKDVEGYDNAAMKEYVALYGFMTFAAGKVIDPENREIVSVQVPPQSRALFTRYQVNQGVLIQRKLAPAHPGIRLLQEKQTAGTRKFASIKFGPEKDKAIIDSFFVAEAE